ncbi:methionine aminotransferase [Pseudohaliea rubra]|uniref:Aspartate aminotransferase n=1 Tax=Pseudohaliea rubra DSM 19751 TaxID=1265313 RepID=A0A095VTI7_9GAMM|nr:methionine aminotransferase [Pseudohaliea rubra]KGE04670.1 Aspartate aminotransferase [Pseudohaliea rubra DSM 19751]
MAGIVSVDSKLPGVGTTIFSTMTALAQECGAINLSQGFPDFDPPAALVAALGEAASAGHNQYPPLAGLPQLRAQLAAQLARYRGVTVDPEAELTVVPGATEGLYCAITAVVRPGDEVIVLDPAYDSYEPAVTLAGGRTVHVPLTPENFAIDWDRVRAAITPRTRLFMLNSPHNPCGSTVNGEDLATLAELAERHDFLVCSDEVYEHLVFDGAAHQSVLQHPALRARSFAHYSFGKTFSVTGWKTGYCVAPPALTKELRKVHQFVAFVAVTPVQHALAAFLEAHPDYPGTLAAAYQARRDRFLGALAGSRFRFRPAAGAYFQLLDYGAVSDEPDTVLCERWTREHGVASVPVSVFQAEPPPGQTLLRFCFAKSDEVLEEAAKRLCAI